MKSTKLSIILSLSLLCGGVTTAQAQLDWGRLLSGAVKATQAITISDDQIAEYVHQSVAQMDSQNTVLPANSPYTIRLKRLTQGVDEADGIPLNFKVYQTNQINAFACPDGSVRVYSGIMDIMNDDELLGIIGHEIGHVLKHHSRNALRNQLLTSALRDGISSTGGVVAALTDSQLGTLGEALINAKYSQKQETEADNCGYDFLVSKGKNPWGMVMAFEKMEAIEQQQGSTAGYIAKMFSDHPDTAKRIKNMEKRCRKDGYQRPAEQPVPDMSGTTTTTTQTKKTTNRTLSKKKTLKSSKRR